MQKEGRDGPSFMLLMLLLIVYFFAVFLAGFAALPFVPHFFAQAMIKPPSCAKRMN